MKIAVVLACALLLACSKDKPAPMSPAGKAADGILGSLTPYESTQQNSDASEEEAEEEESQINTLQTPPPTWIFTDNIPLDKRAELQEEMEQVRAFFADQYGVEATGFTVLVGIDYQTLAPVSQDAFGVDLSSVVVPPGHSGPNSPLPSPFVMTANDGSSIMVLIYGRNPFDSIKRAIAHEYFHVLQNQLAPYQTQEVKPYWLVEGLAQYADYLYLQSRWDGEHLIVNAYEDLSDAIKLKGAMTLSELKRLATEETFRAGCDLHPIYVYAMALVGSLFLVEQADEDSYVQYWKLLSDRPTWQQAFEESFGTSIEDFYEAFEEWLPSQLPSKVQLLVWLRWPGKEALSSNVLNRLRWDITVEPEDITVSGIGWGGSTSDGAHTITSPAGEPWTAYLSLWWQSDSCTRHLLGYYNDGELTDQRVEATRVEFTGESSSLEWTLPARPDVLPRLSRRTWGHCTP